MAKLWWALDLIGGTAGALDSLDGASLSDNDAAVVVTGTNFYVYNLDASSGAAESSPDVIHPDAHAGAKRWILVAGYGTSSGVGNVSIENIQTDNTLDPGAVPTTGDKYVLTDVLNLHANFGVIAGVANDDVVNYNGVAFEIYFDANVDDPGIEVLNLDTKKRVFFDSTIWKGCDQNVTVYTNHLLVDPSETEVTGKIYHDVQDAIDYAVTQTPSITNTWCIDLVPGEHTGNFTVERFMTIRGADSTVTCSGTVEVNVTVAIATTAERGIPALRNLILDDLYFNTANCISIITDCIINDMNDTSSVSISNYIILSNTLVFGGTLDYSIFHGLDIGVIDIDCNTYSLIYDSIIYGGNFIYSGFGQGFINTALSPIVNNIVITNTSGLCENEHAIKISGKQVDWEYGANTIVITGEAILESTYWAIAGLDIELTYKMSFINSRIAGNMSIDKCPELFIRNTRIYHDLNINSLTCEVDTDDWSGINRLALDPGSDSIILNREQDKLYDLESAVLDIQVDNTLDPGAAPDSGDRYLLTDVANLHANFGSIASVGDNDIVEYGGVNFSVVIDASAVTCPFFILDLDSENVQFWNLTAWVDLASPSTLFQKYAVLDSILDLDSNGTDHQSIFQFEIEAQQVDGTLDPGANPTLKRRYLITDSASLHANFSPIESTIGDGDIVEVWGYSSIYSYFKIVFDASVVTTANKGAMCYDKNLNVWLKFEDGVWDYVGNAIINDSQLILSNRVFN